MVAGKWLCGELREKRGGLIDREKKVQVSHHAICMVGISMSSGWFACEP